MTSTNTKSDADRSLTHKYICNYARIEQKLRLPTENPEVQA